MNKRAIILIFLLSISIVYSQGEFNILNLNGLTPESILSNQLSQLAETDKTISSFFKTVNDVKTITNPRELIVSQIYGQIPEEFQPLIETSSKFMTYAEGSDILNYNLKMDNNGVVQDGEINYENTDVTLNGIKPGSDGAFSCKKEECQVTIGKNTYTGIEKDKSNFKLDTEGKLVNAEFIVNKQTTMSLSDRTFILQPGTNLNYTLKKDTKGNEYYEIVINSKNPNGIDVSFPTTNGNGVSELQNYNIKGGNVKITSKGIEVYKGTTIEDLNLKYQLKNNGDNPVLIVSDAKNKPASNYLLANSKEFEFNLQQSEIQIKKGNMWGLNISEKELFKISIPKQGAGSLQGLSTDKNGVYHINEIGNGNTALINKNGEFEITNCGSITFVDSKKILEMQKPVTSCKPVTLVTNLDDPSNLFIKNDKVSVCSTSTQPATGSFLKVSGKEVYDFGFTCSVGLSDLHASGDKCFPVAENSFSKISPNFGDYRKTKGNPVRCHAGVDIYTRYPGEVIAIEDGIVIQVEHFKDCTEKDNWGGPGSTNRVLINHGIYVVNYGEIDSDKTKVKVGDRVRAGQLLGIASHCSMLHFELYNTLVSQNYAWYPSGKYTPENCLKNQPFVLENPISYVNELQNDMCNV